MSEFVLHPEAYTDLEEIWDYIAVEKGAAADGVIEEIFRAIRSLARFPYQGHERADLTKRSQRFHTVGEYLIAYAPDKKPLLVTGAPRSTQSPRDCRHAKPERLIPFERLISRQGAG